MRGECLHPWQVGAGHLEHLRLKLTLKRRGFRVGSLEQRWCAVGYASWVAPVRAVRVVPRASSARAKCLWAAVGLLKQPQHLVGSSWDHQRSDCLIDSSCGLWGRHRIEVWLPPSPMALNWWPCSHSAVTSKSDGTCTLLPCSCHAGKKSLAALRWAIPSLLSSFDSFNHFKGSHKQ